MSTPRDTTGPATAGGGQPAPAPRHAWPLGEGSLELGPGVRLLLWDFPRGTPAYDLALLIIALVLLLVPGSFWNDPLWPR